MTFMGPGPAVGAPGLIVLAGIRSDASVRADEVSACRTYFHFGGARWCTPGTGAAA